MTAMYSLFSYLNSTPNQLHLPSFTGTDYSIHSLNNNRWDGKYHA